MANNTVTCTGLVAALGNQVGLSKLECGDLLESVLNEITDCLAKGKPVKISSFASFTIRQKNERFGLNPKTLEKVLIPPHKVIQFRAARKLKDQINFTAENGIEATTWSE